MAISLLPSAAPRAGCNTVEPSETPRSADDIPTPRVVKPTYFDLTAPDVAQDRAFFERVQNWRIEKLDMPYEYYRIQVGPEDEAGIDG